MRDIDIDIDIDIDLISDNWYTIGTNVTKHKPCNWKEKVSDCFRYGVQ